MTFTSYPSGAQVYWVDNLKMPDGSIRTDEKTLTVKGSVGPFFQRMYWKKIQ